jgi:hypothetical protein
MWNGIVTIHVLKIASKPRLTERFLAGIARITKRKSNWHIRRHVLSYPHPESTYADYQTTRYFSR